MPSELKDWIAQINRNDMVTLSGGEGVKELKQGHLSGTESRKGNGYHIHGLVYYNEDLDLYAHKYIQSGSIINGGQGGADRSSSSARLCIRDKSG